MPNLTNSYETVIILSNNLGDEAIAATIEKFKKLIADNGEVESVEDWGKRKFAYPIQKQNEGHYTLINFKSSPEFTAELDRIYNITDGVLRSLIVKPLGALDLRLRKDMQNELKRIQQQMGITFIYVTHDQEEALTMSDTVVVMDKGRIQQIGTPEDIYNEPKNAFVADFIGESNILNGVMVRDKVVKMYGKEFPCVDVGFAENEPVDVVIRPEDIDIVPVEQGQLIGTVTNVTFKGMQYDIIVDFRGFKWLIQTTDHSPVGARIGVKIDPDGFHIMKKSEYSGMFGDYSSYSEEYEELADASVELEEEESEDEE